MNREEALKIVKEARAKGERPDLRNAELDAVDFEKADLRDVDFEGANLQWSNFWKANLRRANFRKANIQNVEFWGACIEGATFEEASIAGSNLEETTRGGKILYGEEKKNIAEKIISANCSDGEKLGMMLANRGDIMIKGEGAITERAWGVLISDLIKWKEKGETK